MLTVCSVFVDGHVKAFTPEYVDKLRELCFKHLWQEHRFVCLTDRPHMLSKEIETVKIKHDKTVKGWWSKLQLFNPAHDLTGRLMYLDLDTLPVNALDAVANFHSQFAIIPTAGNFNPKGYRTVKRYNSSVMVWGAHMGYEIFDKWERGVANDLWGDQDWIAEVKPNLDLMPIEWFPRLSELGGNPPDQRALVVLCKKPKNEEAARTLPWFNKAWQ